jgi:integrase
MCLTAPGRTAKRLSTGIPIDAETPAARAELKRQAQTVYAQAQATFTLDAKDLSPKPTITVAAYLTWYAANIAAHHRGVDREREILKTLTAAFGPIDLASLTKDRVLEWRTQRAQKVAPRTVDRELDVLKHALAHAVPTYLEASPVKGLRRLPAPDAVVTVLSAKDEAKLLKALTLADQTIVLLALDTLMRRSDVLRLQWSHVHKTHLDVVHPKTGSTYKVPISQRLKAALASLPKKGAYVFWHRRQAETPRNQANSLKQMLEDGCRRAKVSYGRGQGITFHSLRHTGATRMLAAGVDIRTVQEIGGWKSLRSLLRYLHPRATRAAVDTIGAGTVFTPSAHGTKTRRKRA